MLKKSVKAGSIPMFAVTGTNGKTTTSRLLYHLLTKLGYNTGLACTGSIIIGGEIVETGDTTGFLSARRILMDSRVEAAVFETARGGILSNGLGYENIDAAVITSLSEDHLGLEGVNTVEELGDVKSVILEEVKHGGRCVVKAQENLLSVALKHIRQDVKLCLFELNKSESINKYLLNKVEAFYIQDGYIVQNVQGEERKLVAVKELPFAHYGISRSNLLNIMACLAALAPLVEDLQVLIGYLKNINCDLRYNPGRQNLIHYKNCSLLIDYGHNREAYEEVYSIVRSLEPSSVTSIITAPGDRKDVHIEELAYIAGLNSSRVILREQANQRGSSLGRVAGLLKSGALRAGLEDKKIININSPAESLKFALETAALKEIIVMYIEDLDSIRYLL